MGTLFNIPYEDWRRFGNHLGHLLPCVCMEECAELIQAISKVQRGMENSDSELPMGKFIEEFADVIIATTLLEYMWDIDEEELCKMIEAKMKRNIKRMEGE